MPAPPRRALPLTGELPLLDAAATAAWERRLADSLPAGRLMDRAGAAIGGLALALAPHAERVWIAAGPGNNGGDGLEAAAWLVRAGKRVDVGWLGDADRVPPDAARALGRAREAGATVSTGVRPHAAPGLAIDALLGVGASRAPAGAIAEAIRSLGGLGGAACPVLAVDLPSGLDPATGQRLGDDCVRADHTLALLTLKPGLVTGVGRDQVGELWLDPLTGAPDRAPDGPTPTAWLTGAFTTGRHARRHAQNKGSFGDVAVVGGATSMAGAAFLASRAAHAAGAGRVYVDLLDRSPSLARLDPVHPELMFRDDWLETAGHALERATVVCGCGGGKAVAAPLRRLLNEARRLVVDADALNAIAEDAGLATALRERAACGQATVLTPHPLEAARLLGVGIDAVQADRLGAARELTERAACTVVLKGSGSVIAAPGEIPRINSTGNASLATAGTGDVLAGWLGGRWAQHSSDSRIDPHRVAFETACLAVAEHGAAAEPAPHGALRAGDLIERLHRL